MGGKKRVRNGNYQDEEEEVIMGFESVYLWVDPVVTGPVFLSVLVTLLSITCYSLLSVLAYTALFVLGTACGIKLYVYVMNTFFKKEVNDPMGKYAAIDPTISEDRIRDLVQSSHDKVNFAILELRRLFFVEDVIDSAKFGLSLWFLTYVGSWFNAMTLLVASWVGLFTIPKIYLNNQKTLDPILNQIKDQLNSTKAKVEGFLPKKKAVVDEVKKEE